MVPNFNVKPEGLYLDNAATTMVAPEVVDAMMPYLEERYGNPESAYSLGRDAREAVETAREQVALLMGVKNRNRIFFTSGGTEANNWAIKGAFLLPSGLIAVSAVEHSSVLEPARWLARVKYVDGLEELPVDTDGILRLDALESVLERGVRLVSVQWVNNETGVIQPVAEIAEMCRAHNVLFHSDAVQAFGKMRLNSEEIGFDMISVSSHKIHGPMGVGALYIREGVELEPLLHGGMQERGMRAGTHGVANIVGFGKACEVAWTSVGVDGPRIADVSRELQGILTSNLKARINGHVAERVPHIVNFTLQGVDSALLCGILGEMYGVAVSKGSACCKGRPSHVLMAMGRSKAECNASVRLSLSKHVRHGDAQLVCAFIQKAVAQARKIDFI